MSAPDRPTPLARTGGARPDPTPMRFALGLTGLVAATAMATSIVRPPAASPATSPGTDPSALPVPDPTAAPALVVTHVTRYVQLQPGETAPPGAKVVTKAAPSPRVVVVTIPAPAPLRRVVTVVQTTTRQSGA